jgi:regulator of sigma D
MNPSEQKKPSGLKMTKYDLLKSITENNSIESLVNAGLLSYISARHLEIYEALQHMTDVTKEEAVKTICKKFRMSRSKVFLIQSQMRTEV